MKQKGKLSVSQAIIEALKDTEKQCELNGSKNIFTIYSLYVRIIAYIGSDDYKPNYAMISRRMRKIRQFGYLDRANKFNEMCVTRIRLSYSYKGNGIYEFKVN